MGASAAQIRHILSTTKRGVITVRPKRAPVETLVLIHPSTRGSRPGSYQVSTFVGGIPKGHFVAGSQGAAVQIAWARFGPLDPVSEAP